MVKRDRTGLGTASRKNNPNTTIKPAVPGTAHFKTACSSPKSSSLFACSFSSTTQQTAAKPQTSGIFRSQSSMSQPTSTCKHPASSKPHSYDQLNQSPLLKATSTMDTDKAPNSFKPQNGPTGYTAFAGYGVEFDTYGSPDGETGCSPPNFYPVPQSFQEAHSFSSSYWNPSDLPYFGLEYGGPDDEAAGTPLPAHLTDEASTDDQTPIHTPDSVTPAASVVGGERHRNMPYAALIYKCLMETPGHKLILQEIYDWFRDYTDKVDPQSTSKGWKNSIRHNLSMNEAFIKVDQEPSPDGKRTFAWALRPSVVGQGHVESTTRYRKTHGHRRSRAHQRQTSTLSQTSIPMGPAPRRNARKPSVSIPTPPAISRLPPGVRRGPVRLAPRPSANPVQPMVGFTRPYGGHLTQASPPTPPKRTPAVASARAAPVPVAAQLSADFFERELDSMDFGAYEDVYPILDPFQPDPLAADPYSAALYRGHQSFEHFPAEPFFAASLPADGIFPYAVAFDPATPDSILAPPFAPEPKYLVGDGSDVAVVEYGDSVFVPSRPSSLENMLLDHPGCAPGDHSIDCWQHLCHF